MRCGAAHELPGPLEGAGDGLAVVHHLLDRAEFECLGRGEGAAGEAEVLGDGRADESGEALGSAGTGMMPSRISG